MLELSQTYRKHSAAILALMLVSEYLFCYVFSFPLNPGKNAGLILRMLFNLKQKDAVYKQGLGIFKSERVCVWSALRQAAVLFYA